VVKKIAMNAFTDKSYFKLHAVVKSSKFFEYGRRPYQLIKKWNYPASKIFKIKLIDKNDDIVFIKLLTNTSKEEMVKHQILVQKEYRILKSIREKCGRQGQYSVIEPLECIKTKHALITKGSKGNRLDYILLYSLILDTNYYNKTINSIKNVGMWLRSFYEETSQVSNKNSIENCIFDEIEEQLKILSNLRNKRSWENLCYYCMDFVGDRFRSIDNSKLRVSMCHGDFVPGNVLVKEDGEITVLDFSDSGWGIIYTDLAWFWQWLDVLKVRRPWHKRYQIEQMKEALLEGFCQGDEDLLDIFWVFRVGALIKKAWNLTVNESCNIVSKLQRRRVLKYYRNELYMRTKC